MDIPNTKNYALDNGTVCVNRHFGKKETANRIITSIVACTALSSGILTSDRNDAIIDAKLRIPCDPVRRNDLR